MCPRPPAPFGRGPAVVQRSDDAMMIAYRLTAHGATGDVIPCAMWRDLCACFESIALRSPVSAVADAAVWVFTKTFGEPLRTYEQDLGEALVVLEGDGVDGPDALSGPRIAVVVERGVKHLRNTWCNRAYDLACEAIADGRLDLAEVHAARCFSLLPSPGAREFGLLSFVAHRLGRYTRSEAYLRAATNTGGMALGDEARAHCERLAGLHPDRPATSAPATASPRLGRLELIRGSNG